MYAAHLAAGLAIKSRVPQAPTTALLIGAFLPDFIWIGLATLHVEPTAKAIFFDDWSHSLGTILLWATLFAALFRRLGWNVAVAMWLAVMSHFLLDLPIHPKPLALYPHSTIRLSLGLGQVAPMNYWLVQLIVTSLLLAACVFWGRRNNFALKPLLMSCAYVLAFHALVLPSG